VTSEKTLTFAKNATALSGQTSLLLGWRPDEFWSATPAELACVLMAMTPEITAPPSPIDIAKLKEAFPDG
jgi:Phage tail assembly chaperone protein, TAC